MHDACGIGFVAHIRGHKSRSIIDDGLEVLRRLSHRAACGADPETGDGAGILVQLPHRFYKRKGLELGFDMPRRRRYGIGQIFLPSNTAARDACERIVNETIEQQGQRVLGWRDVPIDTRHVGRSAQAVLPCFRQVFIARHRTPPSAFERKLYVIRKLIENAVSAQGADPEHRFHIASMSAETIVYKGLLLPRQLPLFYEDLQQDDMVSAIALVHSRFSTNTFPTWDLAQPLRFIAHNGEINTVRGNRNWMAARRGILQSARFGSNIERILPIIRNEGSDSAQFDNVLELLYLGGRSLVHSIMMMIPEVWENNPRMDAQRKNFYQYASSLMEPWDGPAAIAFTDGIRIGATLDRNGLRPARFLITDDERVILASETGVADVPADHVVQKGRLRPGRMFVVDTEEGRVISDIEAKREITSRWPYGRWLERNEFHLDKLSTRLYESGASEHSQPPLSESLYPASMSGDGLHRLQRAFGYSDEDLRLILQPMAETAKEPVGSMGTDTPLAVLSERAPNLFRYFHQLFAQVTNPAIDSIRESLVMSLRTKLGPAGNPFEETPEQCHRLILDSPILTNQQLASIIAIHEGVFETKKLSLCFAIESGPRGLEKAVQSLAKQAAEAIDEGYNILVLSDRGVDSKCAAIPALLAVSAVHQHLMREGTRMQTGLVIETGEAREVHDFAMLFGFGAGAVNPYLAFDSIDELVRDKHVSREPARAQKNYIDAIHEGLLKVMSKMGISTLQSYRGAQIFEAVGLDSSVIDRYFTGTPSRLEGVDMEMLGQETLERHRRGYGRDSLDSAELPIGGDYQWRRQGEVHKWNPATIAKLQAAAAANDASIFEEYSRLVDNEDDAALTLRGLLEIDDTTCVPVSLDEVEPASEIVKRFVTGAMSFGSISAEAHETLAIAMNRIGGRSNSGEGGEESHRYVADANGDSRTSAIKQVASGRFGVTAHYLVNAKDLQIKVAQGAKPGEGGQLPGHKVDDRIAKVRHSTAGVTLISPPPHHDIYSIEDLAQLIYDLQSVNPRARVSVKLVSEIGVGTVAAGVAKAHAGAVIIAGYSGGTGASPISSIKRAGLPWELGLAETQQVLVENQLRGRIRVQVDGGFRTGRDVIVAALLGAEEFGVATAALIVEGCIMLRKCHLNTCSVGIATQDETLRARFAGKPEHIVNFFYLLAEQVRRTMAKLGFRTMDEMVGQVQYLRQRKAISNPKAARLDLSCIVAQPQAPAEWPRKCVKPEPWDLSDHLDHRIIAGADAALNARADATISLGIDNTKRAVGTLLSGRIAEMHGENGLRDNAIHVQLEGTAGQSLGAFLSKGVTLDLMGDANDYVGKGLSGGRIVVRPPNGSRFVAATNVIVGNTVLYGATSGELFASGTAGERFAVRNSGARAVVEGVGDHGCEYMTGGVVVILGKTGLNFAAGMSGGMAFVLDPEQRLNQRCNTSMVELEDLIDESDIWLVHGMVKDHYRWTQSLVAKRVLDNWEILVSKFVKVMPLEYRRVLQAKRAAMRPAGASPELRVIQGTGSTR